MNTHCRHLLVALWIEIGLLQVGDSWASMDNVRLAAHYKPKFVATKAIPFLCDNPATPTIEPNYSPNYDNLTCYNYTVEGPLGPGQIYVVIAHAGAEGVGAVSFGVDYDGGPQTGIDPHWVSWIPCADGLSFPNNDGVHGDFPQQGGGLRLTWLLPESCQTQVISNAGVHAVVGCFYVYAYSAAGLRLTPNNNLQTGPEFAVANCAGAETNLLTIWGPGVENFWMSRIGFGGVFGLNACVVDPVSPTTWGKVKNMYGGHSR